MKLTVPLERVLRVFLADLSARHYGYDLMKAARLPSGTLYPMLARLQDERLVTSEWAPQPDDASGVPGSWASRSRRHALTRPALPGGVLPAIAAVVSWLSLLVVIRAYPLNGSWNYLYAAAGLAIEALGVIAIARFIRWARRQSRRTPRP